MQNFTDHQMEELVKELEQIEIPRDALYVARENAAKEYRLTKQKKHNYFKVSGTVIVLIILFVTCIRVSPTFARTIEKIPGFAPIVELIGYDKGVKDIVKNDYYETLNISTTKNDITLTILGTIADKSGIVLFYQVEAPYDLSTLETKKVSILQNGKPMKNGSISYGWANRTKTKIIKDKIELVTNDSISYEKPHFELNISFKDSKQTTFSISFTLKKKIQPTKTYHLNKNVIVNDQMIHIEKLEISPLRANIKLAADKSNTYQLLRINSIKLLDERGERWGNIVDGTSGFGSLSDGEVNLFIQSNYFRKPKKLTLEMDQIEALPKGDDYILVDFRKKEIIKKPRLDKLNISFQSPDTIEINDKTQSISTINQLFSSAVDQNKNTFSIENSTSYHNENNVRTTYTFDTNKMKNPVQIYFDSYPNYLNGKVKIDIPLK